MSFFNRILAFETDISDLLNPRYWLPDALAGGKKSKTGALVNQSSAMGLSAYFAAMRAISEDVARLPLITYRRLKPRGKERAPDHPLYSILHDTPNSMIGSMALRETMSQHAMGWGNGFAHIVRRNGRRISGLWLIHPSRYAGAEIEGEEGQERRLWYLFRRESGSPEVWRLPSEEVLHIHGLGDDGIQGYGVAQVGCESIGYAMAARDFSTAYFTRGGAHNIALETPQTLEDEQAQRLRQQWQATYSGLENAWRPVILEADMKLKTFSVSPEESQLLETQNFSVPDVCRWFRISPTKVQHLEKASYNNVEQLSLDYVNDTLSPWITRWEEEIKRKLFPNEPDVFAEHLITGMLRGDMAGRGEYYRQRFHIGTLSVNDIRELENENPVEGGDTYFVPLNMAPLDQAAALATTGQANQQGQPDSGTAQPGTERGQQAVAAPAAVDLTPVLQDACGRILRKEQMAVERAWRKHREAPAAFERWRAKFYAAHDKWIAGLLEPIYKAAGWQGAEDFAIWHCENSAMRIAQHMGSLDSEIETWERRSAAMIERMETQHGSS